MSRFLGQQARALEPYVPGEQPQKGQYIKLNTNECPYPPSPAVGRVLAERASADNLRLYSDPEALVLREALAARYGLQMDQVFAANGSDEVLAFAFLAFFDRGDPVVFADLTYGFYPVYAQLCGLAAREVPLAGDYTVCVDDYAELEGHLFLANPNAPTGLALERGQVEEILRRNPDRLVVVDEAYADFADEGVSAVPLLERYDNLLIVRTFSKSGALAGLRVGFALGSAELVAALERIKYSFNPYNLDRLAIAAGAAAVRDEAYAKSIRDRIVATRDHAAVALRALGCEVLPSQTNFLFVRPPGCDGEEAYRRLKERGILVRYFAGARTRDWVRVTVGTDEEMDALCEAIKEWTR